MRCPSCEKFVSYDEPELEEQEPEVDGDNVRLEVRMSLNCADCGDELKETTFELETEVTSPDVEDNAPCASGHEWTAELNSCDATDRYQDKDRNGKTITNFRYRKHLYGVEAQVSVKCSVCNHEETFTMKDETQASAFDELT